MLTNIKYICIHLHIITNFAKINYKQNKPTKRVMAIQYDFYRNPNSGGANKERYHARVVSSGQISTEQLAKEINQECSLTPADIKAVLVSLSDKLAKHLSEGHKVYLEGIGHFQVNLRCKEEVRTVNASRSESIEFKSISYRADNELKKHLRNQKIQRSQTKIHSVEMTEEEIDQKLTEYFKTHETLTRSQFEVLCTQVKSTAHRILQKLVKDGKLKNVSTKQHPVYMPDNGHYKDVAENRY